jgi:uncharacterized membrane protein YsdA (DUF1294 family)
VPITIYVGSILSLSVVSFLAYAVDKRFAREDRRRISERTLHTLDLLGGWPGGWLARRTLHHKTRKTSFVIAFWMTVAMHLAVSWAIFTHWPTAA